MKRPDLRKVQESTARLSRVLFLAAGDDDLVDDVRDGVAFTVQELAEALGVDKTGIEIIRRVLVAAEEHVDEDFATAEKSGAVRVIGGRAAS